MKKALITSLVLFGLCHLVWAGASIDQLMRLELASSEYSADEEDDNFSYPVSGNLDDKSYKSSGRAALYSLILPGSGQYYIEKGFKSKLFFSIESGLWLSYLGFRKYGGFKENSAKGWAVMKAGACADNTDENYWVKMTYYDNRDRNIGSEQGYNQMAAVYDRENAVLFPETPEYFWDWDNPEDRQKYRNLRNQSKTAFERADITVGVIIANHLVSAIEAFFSAGKHNRHLEFADTGFKFKYNVKPSLANPSISISLTKNFY
ncbi:MAG: hypothetical protein GY839_20480 [candidate division Zixibacteria bacterium]|nr:hypothetical protein [candidate division Zixibacteria bacterium]